MQSLQLRAPVPAWVRALCPNVECLDAALCTFAAQPERVSTSPASASLAAPATCSRLQSLSWISGADVRRQDKRLLALVRQQLAALPSLTHLHAGSWDFTALGQGDSRAISTSVTLLVTSCHGQPTLPERLHAIFPALRKVELTWGSVTEDVELEALLLHLRHLDVSSGACASSRASRTARGPGPTLRFGNWTWTRSPACPCTASSP